MPFVNWSIFCFLFVCFCVYFHVALCSCHCAAYLSIHARLLLDFNKVSAVTSEHIVQDADGVRLNASLTQINDHIDAFASTYSRNRIEAIHAFFGAATFCCTLKLVVDCRSVSTAHSTAYLCRVLANWVSADTKLD